MKPSENILKPLSDGNLISSNIFCADPTAVEYEGRLYVYGTNDHEQFLNAEKNTYEKIKSLVCFSTDDMVNWTYHGQINVGEIEPYIYNSWAPSICKRVEEDGLTHFYLYFSNSGCGVGVITATSPTGPWTDPLGHPLIWQNMPGLNSPAPFDPGVCIDDNGVGWLAFGGGVVEGCDTSMPGSSKLVQLGKDMVSIASDFIDLKAPYFFEANELNFINGTYVYTYNTNWEERTKWNQNAEKPTRCSMCYMTSKTPLDSDSWVYQDNYFKNPGDMGYADSNNHTHYEKYMGKWYLFYHTMSLQEKTPTKGGFRSLTVTQLDIDEESVKIKMADAPRKGTDPLKNLSPFTNIQGTTFYTSADVWYENEYDSENISVKAEKEGAWIMVKNVDFERGASLITSVQKGQGQLEFIIDDINNQPISTIQIDSKEEYRTVSAPLNRKVEGVHDVYILFSAKEMNLKNWHFKA